MEKTNVYLDHNASSPLMPEVAEAILETEQRCFGNPSSPHWAGREAKMQLEQARNQLSQNLGLDARKLFFTSGGSESNNTLLRSIAGSNEIKHVLISAIEHPSIRETCKILAECGLLEHDEINVNDRGQLEIAHAESLIREETRLISVMMANNETGNLQNLEEISLLAREKGVCFHTDASQALGKVKLNFDENRIHYLTATAHKLGGPKGIGLLYASENQTFQPLVSGGKQERVRRAGTESVALAVGFAKAVELCEIHFSERVTHYQEFQNQIIDFAKNTKGAFFNTDLENSLPNTINVGFRGVSAESLLISLDLDGIAVSTGSACSSGALEASHVLLAMGRTREEAKSSIRISWGWSNTMDDIQHFLNRLKLHHQRILNQGT